MYVSVGPDLARGAQYSKGSRAEASISRPRAAGCHDAAGALYNDAVIGPDHPLSAARIVVFDTETTGLSPTQDHVIEIAALALEGGAETGRFETLIDPGVPIPEALTAIHGITTEMVRGQPPIAAAARRFLEFAGDSVLAAHNAPYDISMLIVPVITSGLRPRGNPVIDTCRLARRLISSPNYQLGTVARSLGIPMPKAHRAMADVEACAEVLKACLARMGAEATLAGVEQRSAARLVFGAAAAPPEIKDDRLALLDAAMREFRHVEIVYRGGSHGDQPRTITPLFLHEIDGKINLSADCHIERALKNFRLDRIASVRPARS
jgi:DNA polymerase III epsilon subunit family exonuclease